MTTTPFKIQTEAVGFSSVEIDGQDVTERVQGFQTQSVIGQPTVVILHSSGKGPIEGEGIVQVSAGDEAQAVVDFLSRIDPETLEREAISRSDWGEGNLTALALQILQEWAGKR